MIHSDNNLNMRELDAELEKFRQKAGATEAQRTISIFVELVRILNRVTKGCIELLIIANQLGKQIRVVENRDVI